MANILVILAAAALLGGCASTEGARSEDAGTGTNAPPAATTTAETTTTTPPAPANPRFGEAYTWDDGLAITVSPPTPFEPSEYAAGIEPGTTAVAFSVKIVNGSAANYDPGLLYVSAQSGNTEASKIYDAENLGDEPTTLLLPGREAVFMLAFAVSNPADVVMQVTPGFEYDAAIFTS